MRHCDTFQPSKGQLQGVQQIHFKRAIFRIYDRYISGRLSDLKRPCSGNTTHTFQDTFQPSKGHVQEIRQIHFKTCFRPQRAMFRKYARYISRHVSALKGPRSGNTPDTFQDLFQPSKGHVQEIRQIHFKTCFSPQRAMFRKYARYISRHVSDLKEPCSGNTPDTFQDLFQPSKGHVQEILQIYFKTCFSPQRAIITEYDRQISTEMYLPYSLKMALLGLKRVSVTVSIQRSYNKCVHQSVFECETRLYM